MSGSGKKSTGAKQGLSVSWLEAWPDLYRKDPLKAWLLAIKNTPRHDNAQNAFLHNACNAIPAIQDGQMRFKAAFRLWKEAAPNESVQLRSLAIAFNTVAALPEKQRYDAALQIWEHAPEGSEIETRSVDMAYDNIDTLPAAKRYQAALDLYALTPRQDFQEEILQKASGNIRTLPKRKHGKARAQIEALRADRQKAVFPSLENAA